MNLKGRNFLTLKDFTPEEITYLIDLSAETQSKKESRRASMNITEAKILHLFLKKTSTRTR